jgi:hypothetical protein
MSAGETQYLWVPGPLPGANEALAACRQARGKGSAYSNMKRAYTLMVMGLAKKAKLTPVDHADIDFVWVERNRKRDKDNVRFAAKFCIDGLVKAGVLKGDGWAHVGSLGDKFAVGSSPGVHVEITLTVRSAADCEENP